MPQDPLPSEPPVDTGAQNPPENRDRDEKSHIAHTLRENFYHCLSYPQTIGGPEKMFSFLLKNREEKNWRENLKTFAEKYPKIVIQALEDFKDEPWAYKLAAEALEASTLILDHAEKVKTLIGCHGQKSWFGDFMMNFDLFYNLYFSDYLFELLKVFGRDSWAPCVMAKTAKMNPELVLGHVDEYISAPEAENWAENIVRIAAKLKPEMALSYSKYYWNRPWGPEVVKEAISHSKLTEIRDWKEMRDQPWYKNTGLRWTEEEN
jgi:hypothetical protein